jgi:hypothetical protein
MSEARVEEVTDQQPEVVDNVDTTDVVEITPNKESLENLWIIESSLRESCKQKNGLTLKDYSNVLNATKSIRKLFSDNTNQADQEELDSYSMLVQACHIQQGQGVFSWEGAEKILQTLEALDKSINDVKSPKLKVQQQKDKFDELRKKNIKNKDSGVNRNQNKGKK